MSKQSSSLSQPVYEYILNMIMTKQLSTGEKIPENKIAEVFGVSRTPVRDAMRQLANEGLINILPNRFAQVAEYAETEILEIGTLRILLDSIAIKLCLLYGSRADFLNLKRIAIECENAYKANDYALRCKYDMEFHMELANITKNSILIKFQKEINLRVQFIILHYPNSITHDQTYLIQHKQIADALIEHNESEALQLMLDHMSGFYNLAGTYPGDFFNFVTQKSF